MNGSVSNLILWLVNGLLGLVMVLIGVIVRQHQKADEEHRGRLDGEVTRLRNRLHDVESKLSGLEALELSRKK